MEKEWVGVLIEATRNAQRNHPLLHVLCKMKNRTTMMKTKDVVNAEKGEKRKIGHCAGLQSDQKSLSDDDDEKRTSLLVILSVAAMCISPSAR